MGYKVAVVGATGNVGREMLDVLAERAFPADEVIAIASRRSQGVECSYGEKTLKAKALENVDFSDVDICLMSAGSAVSKEWAPRIAAEGAVVALTARTMDPDAKYVGSLRETAAANRRSLCRWDRRSSSKSRETGFLDRASLRQFPPARPVEESAATRGTCGTSSWLRRW